MSRHSQMIFLVGVLLFGGLMSMVSFVDTKEVAVVYRLGVLNRILESGIHLHYPHPIETVEQLSLRSTRVVELGEQLVLTGDANLVNINTVAQYEVSEVEEFVLRHKDVDETVKKILQATTVRIFGQSAVEKESFMNRVDLERQVRSAAQKQIERHKLGVELTSLGLQELSAPKAVIDAFNEISSARGEKDTMILSAESYASKVLPDARGEAQKIIEEARAQAFEIVSLAKERAYRYNQLLPIHKENPLMLRQTLRSQTWRNLSVNTTVHQLGENEDLFLPGTTRSGDQQ